MSYIRCTYVSAIYILHPHSDAYVIYSWKCSNEIDEILLEKYEIIFVSIIRTSDIIILYCNLVSRFANSTIKIVSWTLKPGMEVRLSLSLRSNIKYHKLCITHYIIIWSIAILCLRAWYDGVSVLFIIFDICACLFLECVHVFGLKVKSKRWEVK